MLVDESIWEECVKWGVCRVCRGGWMWEGSGGRGGGGEDKADLGREKRGVKDISPLYHNQ